VHGSIVPSTFFLNHTIFYFPLFFPLFRIFIINVTQQNHYIPGRVSEVARGEHGTEKAIVLAKVNARMCTCTCRHMYTTSHA
jgi:hypothetical protein